MSPSAEADNRKQLADALGFTHDQLIQEFGYDDDVDFDLRDTIEDIIGSDLEDEDSQEIVDHVIIWFRKSDGDLVDILQDAISSLDAGGDVWVLTVKAGRDEHVNPATIMESADLAGLRSMNTITVAEDWTATRLASRS
ncbi:MULTISPECIES: DUF3052 domain-containing protein [Helcobacillus]|uniref:DUF3052 family protein n=1 Tax=Helcobacillus massiliensis TaxID=521392 RepID=A0A839QWZ2_9MICO|nr:MULTISPECIES: DUF3052 domain-containing protein [Helcobacillus]MBB3022501.1 hypothetical protein [Helcobacillus massiliensis]MCG7426553.1 DUF3052 domain-containing protein [Helcobacillus sp. ACRRO]MDK7741204.1 DUF3052 domain-containing protein [Helcobacillus massiliensis]WOO94010.1 DUF3052 domain-containing protein [Helcobacillus massiliensis]